MITLNTRRLSELMEASGPALVRAIEAVRKDVDSCLVDTKHQMELRAVREVDDMLLNVFLINNRETMEAAVEYLIQEMTDLPELEDESGVYVHFQKVQTVKDILQTGM